MDIPAQEQRSCSFKHAGLEEDRKGRDLTLIVCLLCDFFKIKIWALLLNLE